MKELFQRHEFGVLAFSGGKDSIAALYLMRDYWDKIVVMWCNTGAALPETIEQIGAIKKLVPNFYEVKSNQAFDIYKNGHPVDVLPIHYTQANELLSNKNDIKLRNVYECCNNNIWTPTQDAIDKLGATLVIRGTKDSDQKRAKIESGSVFNGIEYFFPCAEMTDDDVYKYLKDNDISLPPHYEYVNTSLDCWSCTAYMYDNVGRVKYLKDKHPEKYIQVRDVLTKINECITNESKYVKEALEV